MNRKQFFQFLAVLSFFFVVDGVLQFQLNQMHRKDQVLQVYLKLSALRANIEKAVTTNLLVVQGAADFISVTPDLDETLFDKYAQKAIGGMDLLKNLTAAPNFEMRFVYPSQGNEAVLGLKYRELPGQWEQALEAKNTKKMVVAGPLELVQGGIGLIGRAPVFTAANGGEQRFWGIVSSVIDAEKLFDKVGLEASDLDISIRGKDGKGADGEVFYGDPQVFELEEAVQMPVNFPAGSWVVAAVPKGGGTGNPQLALYVHVFMALLAAATALEVYRFGRRSLAIRTIQESLNQAQAIAHLGSWRLSHATDSIWWSDETYRIFGVDKESFTPTLQSFMDRVHPDDRERVQKAIHSGLDSSGKYAVDHRIVRPAGDIRHVQQRGETAFLDDQSLPVYSTGTILDITVRKQAEAALQAGEERFRMAFENANDGVCIVALDGGILQVNQRMCDIFGYPKEQLEAMTVNEIAHPDDRQVSPEFMERGIAGEIKSSVFEKRYIHKSGRIIWGRVSSSIIRNDQGEPLHFISHVQDISQRKEMEDALRKSEDRYRLLAENAADAIWTMDENQNFTFVSPSFERLFGYTLEDLGPGLPECLLPEQSRKLIMQHVAKRLRSLEEEEPDRSVYLIELEQYARDNTHLWIEATTTPIFDDNDQYRGVVGVSRDITARKRAEDAIKASEEKMRIMATTDDMTKLYNRRRFIELVQGEMDRSRRYASPFSLIMLDADKFKAVNDTYGHDVGDKVLQAIASTAKDTLRNVDILGRLGGEEFAAGLPETGLNEAMLAAERLRAAMENVAVAFGDGGRVSFTVSLGVAELDGACKDVDALLKQADLALYAAKKKGRNRAESYSSEMG